MTDYVPSVAIYHHGRRPDLAFLSSMVSEINRAGLAVELEKELYDRLSREGDGCVPVEFPTAGCRMVMSLGGDGTFLRAARWTLRGAGAPVAGINAGTLGFLTAWERQDFPRLLDMAVTRRIPTHDRSLLQVSGPNLPDDIWPLALNEIAMLRSKTSQMITVSASLCGDFLAEYAGDGLIVSTPAGSTGYNLSAGGPIIIPGTRAMALTPVAPHTLTQRPLVVGADVELDMCVTGRSRSFLLSIDGHSVTLPIGSRLKVCGVGRVLKVVRNDSESFASRLRAKLMWGQNPAKR